MIDLFILTILIGMTTGVILSIDWYHIILIKIKLNMKPFNCTKCLGIWTALLLFLLYFDFGLVESILGAFGSACVSDLVHKNLTTY